MDQGTLAVTSALNTTCHVLAQRVTARLTAAGYPWNQLAHDWQLYLEETLSALTGGAVLLSRGRSAVLAGILNALGGSGDARTLSEVAIMIRIIDLISEDDLLLEDGSDNFILEDDSESILLES